ncbi:MAG TPA: thioredoxin family protein, partial [Actinomycetota bacterium]|nr:thioredoxin family protein [Actinomycetota bacterium]
MVSVNSTMMPLGSEMPSFELPDPFGQTYTSSSFSGTPLLVMFICNHCPYVKHIRPRLAEVTKDLAGKGLAVVGINSNDADLYPDDSPEAMRAEAEEYGYTFPYLVDQDQSVAKAFRAACTPDLFLFDSNGRLAYRGQFDGSRPKNDIPVTGEDLVAAAEAVLEG